MTDKRHCKAKTKAGKPCKANPMHDRDVCLAHADEETRTSVDFGQGPRPGRPPTPKLTDILRDQVEAEIEEWLAPLYRAREADRAVVVGNGPTAHVEHHPDLPTQLSAVREVLDRVYGRPKQTQEVTGPEGGPIVLEAPVDAEERAVTAARLLAEHGLIPAVSGNGRNGHG